MKFLTILSLAVLVSSCFSYNRLTSPKPLDKKEFEMNVGATAKITSAYYETIGGVFNYEPVFGYRLGLGGNSDLGLRVHGVYYPQIVVDWKHQFLQRGDFYFSGDVCVQGGVFRSIGVQYDLLFGKEQIYGVLGTYYDFLEEETEGLPAIHAGIGTMSKKNSGFGFQVNLSISPSMYSNRLDVGSASVKAGIVYNLRKTKKKYR